MRYLHPGGAALIWLQRPPPAPIRPRPTARSASQAGTDDWRRSHRAQANPQRTGPAMPGLDRAQPSSGRPARGATDACLMRGRMAAALIVVAYDPGHAEGMGRFESTTRYRSEFGCADRSADVKLSRCNSPMPTQSCGWFRAPLATAIPPAGSPPAPPWFAPDTKTSRSAAAAASRLLADR